MVFAVILTDGKGEITVDVPMTGSLIHSSRPKTDVVPWLLGVVATKFHGLTVNQRTVRGNVVCQ